MFPIDFYEELKATGENFEIVLIPLDEDDKLDDMFKVDGLPHFVILDETGEVLTDDGVDIIQDYEAPGYPFTPERIQILKKQEETTRTSILAFSSRKKKNFAGSKRMAFLFD